MGDTSYYHDISAGSPIRGVFVQPVSGLQQHVTTHTGDGLGVSTQNTDLSAVTSSTGAGSE